METKKIAVACFIGGALCSAVELMFAPVYYWWFGLIAGMAGGYISYEFREVCKAIPIALCAVGRGSVNEWDSVIAEAKAWLSKPHPFFYPAAIAITPLFVWATHHLCPHVTGLLKEGPLPIAIIFLLSFFVAVVMGFVILAWIVIVPFFTLAFIGARVGERCYWQPFVTIEEKSWEIHIQELNNRKYSEKPLTYLNVLHWVIVGIIITIRFFAWTLWKYLAIGAWATLCFFGRFAWHLFKLIHSKKRVLCAIDGTLGGAVSYIWLASSVMSFPEQVMLVIFGGLLGAAFGMANWEIVSKRILRVTPANNV